MSDARDWPEAWLEAGDGQRYPITHSVVVGRAADVPISLEDGERTVARRHCVLRRAPSGAVEVQDLGSTNGTLINGQRVAVGPLVDGDVLTVGNFRLVFHAHAAPEAPPDELKQKVAEAPHLLERWLVWADALGERGDARGAYIVSQPGPQSLGPVLDAMVRDQDLVLTWRLGHVASARFFEISLEALLEFVTHPLVELISELQLPHLGGWLPHLAKAPLPALSALRIGPVHFEQAAALRAAVGALTLRAPRLTAVEVLRFERAWLEHADGQQTQLGTAPVTLGACAITRTDAGWRAQRMAATGTALLVNDVSRWSRALRPHDVLRIGSHTVTFRAEERAER